MPAGRLAGFGLVWVALMVLTVDGIRHRSHPSSALTAGHVPLVLSEPVVLGR